MQNGMMAKVRSTLSSQTMHRELNIKVLQRNIGGYVRHIITVILIGAVCVQTEIPVGTTQR